jgi:amidase
MTAQSQDLAFMSASELIERLKTNAVSAVELTEYFIKRIEVHDETLNAVVVRDFDRARAAARAADESLARGKIMGRLHGLPMTVKETFDVAGLATTWGNPEAKSNIAQTDSVMVARLKRAGATILGKTNTPLMAADFQTYNAIYGQTNNPWDLTKGPGGSSGGSAVAAAAGLTGMEFGSDTGGSLRNPAHFCGVYAHKPTWGILPFRSQTYPGAPSVPQELDMASPGPIARSADDLALAVSAVAGPDALTSLAWKLDLPRPRKTRLRDMRIALWPDEDRAPVDSEIAARVTGLGDKLAKVGATVSDKVRPDFTSEEIWQTYRTLVLALTGGPDGPIDHQHWLECHLKRGQYRLRWQSFFRDWDVLVTPITSTVAFPHDHSAPMTRTLQVNGETRGYWEHVFWAGLATMPYLPATVFPTGRSKDGLPIGLQVIGAEFDDLTTIEFARLVAQEFGGFTRPEGFGL